MKNNVTKKHYFNYQNYYQNSNLKIKHKTSTKYLYITNTKGMYKFLIHK